MKNPFTSKAILSNLGLKLLGLVLALMLWFHVATKRDYETEIEYTFEYVNLPDSLVLAAPPPDRIVVRAHGAGKLLLRTLWQNRHWPIDLSDVSTGTIAIPLRTSDVPLFGIEGVQIAELRPSSRLMLRVDVLDQKSVPVASQCRVETAPGYVRVGPESWTPGEIVLRGPRSALEEISEIQSEPVEFADENEPIDREVDLVLPDRYGVVASPTKARLRQNIEPYEIREFQDLVVRVATTTARDTSYVVPGQINVSVGGPESAINALSTDSITVVCAVADQDTSGTLRSLWVQVPEPLEVLKTEPDSVTVWRDLRPRTSTGD